MSEKILMATPCCGSCDLRYVTTGEDGYICPDFYKLDNSCKNYQPKNPIEIESKLFPVLTDARQVIQNIYNNTDFCTCPPEGDCVCGQDGLLKIMKKIDEVIG